MKTEEKAIKVRREFCEKDLNEFLALGWRVKQMCAFSQSSTYAEILVILEKDEKDT